MPDFSPPPVSDDYLVSGNTTDHPLQVLFDITDLFLNRVLSGPLLPDDFPTYDTLQQLTDNLPNDLNQRVGDIVVENIRILIPIVVGLVLVVVVPIVGLAYCCCCCNSKPRDKKKNDGFWSLFLGFTLFLFLALTTLGTVWFFLGNSSAQQGVEEAPQELKNMVHDGELFLNNTIEEIGHLMEDNFQEAIAEFNKTLDQTAVSFGSLIEEVKTTTNITNIIETSQHFLHFTAVVYGGVIDQVLHLKTAGVEIQNEIRELENALCSSPAQLPVCPVLDGIDQAIGSILASFKDIEDDSGITPEVVATMNSFSATLESIGQTIDGLSADFIGDYFGDINNEITSIGDMLSQEKDSIVNITRDLNIFADANGQIDEFDRLMGDYYNYFFLSLVVIGSLVVLILLLIFIGLVLGCCGSPGTSLAAQASTVYKTSIGIFLGLGVVFFLLTVIFFVVGAFATKLVCQTLEEPEVSDLVKLANPVIEAELRSILNITEESAPDFHFDMASFIRDLEEGRAIYPLLYLDYVFNITELEDWQTTYNISTFVDEAEAKIGEIVDNIVRYEDSIGEDMKQTIRDTSVQVDRLLTGMPWENILDETAVTGLNNSIDQISGFVNDFPELQKLTEDLSGLVGSFSKLQTFIKDNMKEFHCDKVEFCYEFHFSTNVEAIFTNLVAAFGYIKDEGRGKMLAFFSNSVASLLGVVDEFIVYAVNYAQTELGSTGPLGRIYSGLTEGLCHNILDPFNSVWSGLGWTCLMLLVPVAILVHLIRSHLNVSRNRQTFWKSVSDQDQQNPMGREAATPYQVPLKYRGPANGGQPPPGGYPVPDHYKGQGYGQPPPGGYPVPDHYKGQGYGQPPPGGYPVPDHYKGQGYGQTPPGGYPVPDHYKGQD